MNHELSHRSTAPDRGVDVNDDTTAPGSASPMLSRRTLLRAGVVSAAFLGSAAVLGTRTRGSSAIAAGGLTTTRKVHLAATDGWVSLPENYSIPGYFPDTLAPDPYNMYVFGFRDVTGLSDSAMIAERGKAQISAPVLAFDQDTQVEVTLTNLGLSQRPDLVDGHTMHWHGFNNAIPIFDGVPEMSASVPIGKSLTYLFRPRDAGTYMYHCHFEDVEHVQMGMTGLVFVRPTINKDTTRNPNHYTCVYNDLATRYDREYPLFLSENMPEDHWRDAHIQVSDWSDYIPGFGLFNGRAFPDTLEASYNPLHTYPSGSTQDRLKYQPQGSRIEAHPGDIVLLRVAHLGSVRHTITIDGVPLHVIGADATQLKNPDGSDNSYWTNGIDLGPGESRDVLFTAPEVGEYLIYDRNVQNLTNNGGAGYGGMLTKLIVKPAGEALTAQTVV